MTRPGGQLYHRSCYYCSAHMITYDHWTRELACNRCRQGRNPGTRHMLPKPFEEWAASLKPGDRCYVQPILAWHGLAHSANVVIERTGDQVTVQIVGLPESRQAVSIHQLGERDMTPRRQTGAMD